MRHLHSLAPFPHHVALADPDQAAQLKKKQDEARRIVPPLKETPKIIKSVMERLK